jgi:hypothetical protein
VCVVLCCAEVLRYGWGPVVPAPWWLMSMKH